MNKLKVIDYRDEVAAVLDSYPSLSDEDKASARSWLNSIGLGEAANKIEEPLDQESSSSFTCPVFKSRVVTPCRLSSCRFHVDYSWSNNCMLAYMHDHNIQSLSLEEIAILYGMSINEVRSEYKSGLQKLRSEAFLGGERTGNSISPSFSFFKTKKVCCVCESRIDYVIPQSLSVQSVGVAYCSKECKQEKPHRLIEIEHEYGLDISSVLEWVFTHFKNLGLAEQALGIPRWLAYYACKAFLGYELHEYFASLKKTRTSKNLVRRTWNNPTLVESIIGNTSSIRDFIYAKYGQPHLDSPALLSTLDCILSDSS